MKSEDDCHAWVARYMSRVRQLAPKSQNASDEAMAYDVWRAACGDQSPEEAAAVAAEEYFSNESTWQIQALDAGKWVGISPIFEIEVGWFWMAKDDDLVPKSEAETLAAKLRLSTGGDFRVINKSEARTSSD